jgi:hypothetical protein
MVEGGWAAGLLAALMGAAMGPVSLSVDCRADGVPISPLIYGIGFDARLDATSPHQWQLGATARRWGGNTATRYKGRLGHAWNTASDWYFPGRGARRAQRGRLHPG